MKKFGIGILVITMIAVGIGIYWTQGEKVEVFMQQNPVTVILTFN